MYSLMTSIPVIATMRKTLLFSIGIYIISKTVGKRKLQIKFRKEIRKYKHRSYSCSWLGGAMDEYHENVYTAQSNLQIQRDPS